jgi:membrane-associated phospholipid phosphatase
MINVLYSYVTILCFLRFLFQGLPAQADLALALLARGYAVPTGLALAALIRWFEGPGASDRAANQREVLRGLIAALVAWGLAALIGLAWKLGLSHPAWEPVLSEWTCWHGPPYPSPAAAVGFALGTMLWRLDWRWGLGYCLAAGLWTGAQVCYGVRYPMDVIIGTVIGAGSAWLLGYVARLDRPLNALIRLARRLMLA